MDFYKIKEKRLKDGGIELSPNFLNVNSKDLMIRGGQFYAIWNPETLLWSTNTYDVGKIVDRDLYRRADELKQQYGVPVVIKSMMNFDDQSWEKFKRYTKLLDDNYVQLDTRIIFDNEEVVREDYVSRKALYPLVESPTPSYDGLMSVIYNEEERRKLEWAIGAVLLGEHKDIHKFIVLYGEPGSGKSTFLNIVEKLFQGYLINFEASTLVSTNASFATEIFKSNPLVAIQHDGDLSKIEDNTRLNSIISHEYMVINEKYKSSYSMKVDTFLFLGTNKPVKITDAKSGMIRRLIDVSPSGNRVTPSKYEKYTRGISHELGGIASHCIAVYKKMGKNYYNDYVATEMMFKTDLFFNFVEDNQFIFKAEEYVTLTQAYDMYKIYCEEALIQYKMPKYSFREELKNYFSHYEPRYRAPDGSQPRHVYYGFLTHKMTGEAPPEKKELVDIPKKLELINQESLLDGYLGGRPAQYANEKETPTYQWDAVTTTLNDLDTSKVHYVRPQENHIVIDFDLRGEDGEKSRKRNIEEASKWPATYAEFSKGGNGIHLHYIYSGDVTRLSRVYDDEIEIKVFTGKSSLRRRLTKCNNTPIAQINSGLPLKGDKVINENIVMNEKIIRTMIRKNLEKEYHPSTASSVSYIKQILDDAYKTDVVYDVTDLRNHVLTFAANSTNQARTCLKMVNEMQFKSEVETEPLEFPEEAPIVFYDVEVFPNLLLIVWKYQGSDSCQRMFNPTSQQVSDLFRFRLIGHNVRRYDNHILYARYLGRTIEEIYQISQRLISNSKNATFREAYNISYTDTYDFLNGNNKKGLKKLEIELGLKHNELPIKWDEEVPRERWDLVAEYCEDDVRATEAVFNHFQGDFVARQILAELSGLTVNDTTQNHAAKIMFGNERNPQSHFIYTDLSTIFPGYKFEYGKSTYRGFEVGEGGWVWAKPGIWNNVELDDIASMHPSSAIKLNVFGKYTKNLEDLKNARLAIKKKEFDSAKQMLGGILTPYLKNQAISKDLSYALKIVINIIYGLTFATFDNPFKDPRNKDNIVAKYGALFMVDLWYELQKRGDEVIHIKTDSVKIANATDETYAFIKEFGKKYGFDFEREAFYNKLALVNNAVYVAYGHEFGKPNTAEWTAVGAQFKHPYVFKKLFSKEAIEFADLCETKQVKSALYLDLNEHMWGEAEELSLKELRKLDSKYKISSAKEPDTTVYSLEELTNAMNRYAQIEEELKQKHDYQFIGKIGEFTPMLDGAGGGNLLREDTKVEGKFHHVTGTKGYKWLESHMVKTLQKENLVDTRYFATLVDDAIATISEFGDAEQFIS